MEDVSVAQLEESLGDLDGAHAVGAGAVDNHEGVWIRDPPRRDRVDPVWRDVDRAREVSCPVRDGTERIDENEIVASLHPRMKLGAVDLGEGSGHALDGTRGLEPDDELALAPAPPSMERSEPLQEREDARVVAAHRGHELRDAGSARIGCELAREDGPDTMALVLVCDGECDLRSRAGADEARDPTGSASSSM